MPTVPTWWWTSLKTGSQKVTHSLTKNSSAILSRLHLVHTKSPLTSAFITRVALTTWRVLISSVTSAATVCSPTKTKHRPMLLKVQNTTPTTTCSITGRMVSRHTPSCLKTVHWHSVWWLRTPTTTGWQPRTSVFTTWATLTSHLTMCAKTQTCLHSHSQKRHLLCSSCWMTTTMPFLTTAKHRMPKNSLTLYRNSFLWVKACRIMLMLTRHTRTEWTDWRQVSKTVKLTLMVLMQTFCLTTLMILAKNLVQTAKLLLSMVSRTAILPTSSPTACWRQRKSPKNLSSSTNFTMQPFVLPSRMVQTWPTSLSTQVSKRTLLTVRVRVGALTPLRVVQVLSPTGVAVTATARTTVLRLTSRTSTFIKKSKVWRTVSMRYLYRHSTVVDGLRLHGTTTRKTQRWRATLRFTQKFI